MGGTHQPLTARFGAWSFFAFGVLLALPSLGLGLWSDDWGQGLFLQKVVSGQATSRPWWDLYVLVPGEPGQRFSGVLPWWSSEDLRVAFFRPVAAATHVMDYAVWPNAPWAMHLHSALWFGASCGLAYRFLSKLAATRPAFVASALFAVAYVHASPVSWIAQRNALIATALGLAALSFAFEYLEKNKKGSMVAAAALLGFALLASEGAALAAAAMVLLGLLRVGDRRRWVVLLASIVAVVLAWRLAYAGMGYGVRGSGTYIDPLLSPSLLVSVAPLRSWRLLTMHFVPVQAEFFGTSILPQVIGGLIAAGLSVWCFLRRERSLVRYCCAVVGCAVLLLSVAEPSARLLSLSVVFSALLVATALDSSRWGMWGVTAVGLCFAASQQWMIPRHEMRAPAVTEELGELDARLEELGGKTLVLIDPPEYAAVHRLQRSLVHRGIAWPTWWLVLVTGDAEIQRDGCCTVLANVPGGAFQDPSARFFAQDPVHAAPFAGLWFTANQTTDTTFQFTFKAPIDTPHLVFATWRNGRWELWPSPAPNAQP